MRVFPKRAWLVVLGLVLVMAVSACGGTTAPTTAPTPTTVNGKTTTILTNAQGHTLYYFTPDTASKMVCTSSCAQTWPPLLFTGTGKPTASTALPGE